MGDLSVVRLQNSLVHRGTLGVDFVSTLVDTPLTCSTFSKPFPKVANSIVFGTAGTDVWNAQPLCTYSHDLMSPQSRDPGGTAMILNMDPKFASPSTGDYHLMQGSPAIDAGDPSAQDSHDFDGTPRPRAP